MLHRLTENAALKAIALVLAIALYLFVRGSRSEHRDAALNPPVRSIR